MITPQLVLLANVFIDNSGVNISKQTRNCVPLFMEASYMERLFAHRFQSLTLVWPGIITSSRTAACQSPPAAATAVHSGISGPGFGLHWFSNALSGAWFLPSVEAAPLIYTHYRSIVLTSDPLLLPSHFLCVFKDTNSVSKARNLHSAAKNAVSTFFSTFFQAQAALQSSSLTSDYYCQVGRALMSILQEQKCERRARQTPVVRCGRVVVIILCLGNYFKRSFFS